MPGTAKDLRQRDLRSTATAASVNRTANSENLRTWWHSTGEINTKTAVRPENVRQSHVYSVQIASASTPTDFYDSFVYESIPRNGNGNICDPTKPSVTCNVDDQITIEGDIGADMAWTQYLANGGSIIKITRSDQGSVNTSDVVIRPQTLEFSMQSSNDSLLITVPHSPTGYRFSVEFKDNLWEYRNAGGGVDSHYVQNKNPDGLNYVESYTSSMPVVGVEPLNALMVFMSPFPADQYVPDITTNTYKATPGLIPGLDKIEESVLYFGPGVYWCTGSAHMNLSSSVSWIYLAPGAYVKGAVEYNSQSLDLRATGFGVLSGEQYLYQANTAQGYQNIKSDDTSLKMWRGQAARGAKWTINGLTMNAPPFNSMDFYGNDPESFNVDASDYKQVGAFFGQTDGLQMYPGSHVRDIFYHVGDDAIKTYYSNVLCERMTIWKTTNAPIVQFGWYQRDVDNVTVDRVDVIHTRYNSQEVLWPRALVASAASYVNQESTSVADITKHLSNYTISNWRCEGICPALMGINPLQNIDTMSFSNIWIEEFSPITTEVGVSTFRSFSDGSQGDQVIALGDNSPNKLGLVIDNFVVGNTRISFAAGNWEAHNSNPSKNVGLLNIDGGYSGRWIVT
ncbi:hypothetical protein SLS60_012056 [Paraconiothyrium brasiliense]|uniref:Dextranase n=1 Tax=Paraconiothyrium brasiliense TaxID=300254 RepID=A0ABR3QHN6_9PLEO